MYDTYDALPETHTALEISLLGRLTHTGHVSFRGCMLACCEWIDDFSGPSGCRILELTSSMAAQSSVPRNVHFRHTARLINALIAAQKPYQLLLFPNDAWQDLKCLVLRCRLGRKILDAVLAEDRHGSR